MSIAFIDGMAIPLEAKCKEGDIITEEQADLLNDILHRRVKAKLRWLLSRGEISREEVQAKAIELCDQPLAPYATLDDSDEPDPVLVEALSIAKETITKEFMRLGLPLPDNLDPHMKALVDNTPAIVERARRRMEARYQALRVVFEEETDVA